MSERLHYFSITILILKRFTNHALDHQFFLDFPFLLKRLQKSFKIFVPSHRRQTDTPKSKLTSWWS